MKLSALRPCDACGGPLLKPHVATFLVVESQQAMINPVVVQQLAGMGAVWNQDIFKSPRALAMAEIFIPQSDDAVWRLGDKEPELKSNLLLCLECATPVMLLVERVNSRKAVVPEQVVGG